MKVLEGKLVAGKGKFAIVGARFNEFIVSKLISGAEDTLVRHGVDTDDITLVWVPGAFEIPLAAQKLAQSGKYDAVICLGAVIRGSTSHYELVCSETAKGIAQVGLQTGVPVTFGVITTENIEQAIERAGTKAGNKGADAAMAALDPKTADKVLQITEEIVARDNLTTMMVTHNMKHAIQYGNRLIMMDSGRVVVDIRGEEKKHLTVRDLLEKFNIENDRMLLSE